MELPKNVTQIGESDRSCKVYVEDYVVSYLKQLNQAARNKDIAVALFGIRKEEGEVSYLFLYGACKLNFLQRETRHLSQAQQQEVEKNRQRYFSEYDFQGYRLLNGDMIEGFHICERGVCRYIAGYAQFYEKNDSMLSFMLETRTEEAQPEIVNQEKYESARRRQEARKAQVEEGRPAEPDPLKVDVVNEQQDEQDGLSLAERQALSQAWKPEKNGKSGLRQMKVAAVAVFALLCFVGLSSMNGDWGIEDIQVMARQALTSITEQKLPDEDVGGAVAVMNPSAGSDTLIAEDRLTEALRQENEQTAQENVTQEETSQPSESASAEVDANAEKPSAEQPSVSEAAPSAEAEGQALAAYVIKQGDTLISICIRNYGSDARIQEICNLNDIKDPDDIKVGQKILLPQ